MFLKTCSALRSDNLDGVVKNVTNQHSVQETLTEFFLRTRTDSAYSYELLWCVAAQARWLCLLLHDGLVTAIAAL